MENTAAPVTLATKLQFLPGVGPGRAKRLQRLGLNTVRDLLFLFPRGYEHPAPPAKVTDLREGQPASLVGTITDAEIVSRTPGKSVFGAIVENDTGAVRILFFNQPFRSETLTFDRQVMISGEPKLNGLRWEFTHPKVTILGDDNKINGPKILPVYPLTEGVKQLELRRLTGELLPSMVGELSEVMPARLRDSAAIALRLAGIKVAGALPTIDVALQQVHHPDDEHTLLSARTRFIFQELLVMQLALAMRRRKLTTALKSPPLESSAIIDARITKRFPFELTGDQRKAMEDVGRDMGRQFPMNRLLQGDVGSGKTVVAIYAMMLAVANGHQAVLMAPTEVLARQHYRTLTQILSDSRVKVGLLCGSLSAAERRETLQRIAAGEVDLIVGTQALLFSVEFADLGLCVIDEQQKFCLLYTSPSPRDKRQSRMPSSA